MECNINLKMTITDYVNLLIVIKIRFGSIVEKSMGRRISRRAGLKQG
jgi:hypothetical protein